MAAVDTVWPTQPGIYCVTLRRESVTTGEGRASSLSVGALGTTWGRPATRRGAGGRAEFRHALATAHARSEDSGKRLILQSIKGGLFSIPADETAR